MSILIVSIILTTSAIAYVVGIRRFGLRPSTFTAAGRVLMEWIGFGVVFLVLNVSIALAVVLVARTSSLGFISAYAAGDVFWLALSFLQAAMFQFWRGQNESRVGGSKA